MVGHMVLVHGIEVRVLVGQQSAAVNTSCLRPLSLLARQGLEELL